VDQGDPAGCTPSQVTELQTEMKKLKHENERLRMEREILKKTVAFFAKELVRDFLLSISRRWFIFCIYWCEIIEISRSGCYRWKKRDPFGGEQERAQLIPRIKRYIRNQKQPTVVVGLPKKPLRSIPAFN
jgi:hypothetical protein